MRDDAHWRRCATLGTLLFGRTAGDLRRQLLACHPQIPSGFALSDFLDLQRHLEIISGALPGARNTWLSPLAFAASAAITVGTQRLSVSEGRCEIVYRAIDYLENR